MRVPGSKSDPGRSPVVRRRGARLVALTAATALLATACGGSSDDDSTSGSSGDTTLRVGLFGTFGYEESGLFEAYEAANPGVTIEYTSTQQENDYWTALQTKLDAGSGLADIQGIEVARIHTVAANQGDKWVDLKGTDLAEQIAKFPAWKEDAATTEDGAVLGMGTDIGPMAICYRSDLLQQAGMPTDPKELSAAMGSWEDYIALGEQYKAKASGASAWTDAASGLYNAVVSTESKIYYDESGELVWDSNPAVKSAFDLSADAASNGLTAKLSQFSPQWDTAFSSGSFATIACPSWMIGYIKGKAGDAGTGKWNVAALPGGKGGNWGGAYLAIPKASKNQEEAAKLVKFLTDGEQQAKVFAEVGNFPSNTDGIAAVGTVTDEYFSGAAIGEIFGGVAKAAPQQILGDEDGVIKQAISDALGSVETNGVSTADAWKAAQDTVQNQVG